MKTNIVDNLTFGILLWLFNLQTILSTPVQHPASRTILKEMMSDPQLCSTSKFLYKSDFVKDCSSLIYPNDAIKLNPKTVDKFFCLAVYDAAYQICQNSTFSSPKEPSFQSNLFADFNSSVENQLARNDDYCSQLQGLRAEYNKTRPYVSQLAKELNKPKVCFAYCLSEDDNNDDGVKFKSLCAVMAWIVSMEQGKNLQSESSKLTVHPKVVKLKQTKTDLSTINTNQSNNSIAPDKQSSDNRTISNEKSPPNQLLPTIKKAETHLNQNASGTETIVMEKTSAQSIHDQEKDVKKITQSKEITAVPVLPAISEVKPNPPIDTTKNNAKGKSTENVDKGLSPEEVSTSTLSENTGDREDPVINQGDLAEDGPNHYDFLADSDDTNDQVLDIGNRNPNGNLLESSKQRDPILPLYHNTRPRDDSHFFTYISVISLLCILGFIGFHNKQKILAIMLEGRRSRSNRGRRRPSTANYRKLDCTLEEAMTSQCNANVTHVIY